MTPVLQMSAILSSTITQSHSDLFAARKIVAKKVACSTNHRPLKKLMIDPVQSQDGESD